ncbi:MAG: 16S rRNA (cytidine(1402)-2'-O)-methyltransferase [Thermodesulfobacteriota bacterium]
MGALYIIATPIGHLDDITLRALRTLKEVDLVAAEDTRHTARLLSHHGIQANLISFHEHNEAERTADLITRLEAGEAVAVVSDAGTPSVSDPGFRLVRAAVEKGIRIVPIPGPSAAITALSASGLPTDAFTFIGFPPKKPGRRQALLEGLKASPYTLIFYESPKRIAAFIDELIALLGDRQAVLGREMTKTYEEFIRGPLSDIQRELENRPQVKGECTLLISGAEESDETDIHEVREEIADALESSEIRISELSKRIAKKYGISKNEVYAEALRLKNEERK